VTDMSNALVALGGAFVAAGLLARLGRRVGLPTIPFFMAAGIITGPHTPGLVLVENPADLEVFAAVGLIMLLFHLGIEFSLDDLINGGPRLLATGGLYILLNVGGGLTLGFTLGWGTSEAFVIAGAVGISSTAIVTKLLVELRRLANRETPMILGVIVVEDVFLALYLALLQPILGQAGGPAEALLLFGRALGFLTALFLLARFGAHWIGRLVGSEDDELLTVLFVGIAVLVAGIAEEIGVSEAIGAFMVGLILAETKAAPRIEHLVLPLRDAFAAVFFFAFGLTIDPGDVARVVGPVAAGAVLSIVLTSPPASSRPACIASASAKPPMPDSLSWAAASSRSSWQRSRPRRGWTRVSVPSWPSTSSSSQSCLRCSRPARTGSPAGCQMDSSRIRLV